MPSIVLIVILFLVLITLLIYLAVRKNAPCNVDRRLKTTRFIPDFTIVECGDDDSEKEPAKPKKVVPGDNKEKRSERLARLHADMLVRSDKRLTEYQDDHDSAKLCVSNIFYNKDSEGSPEIVVISEFSDETTSFYYAAIDKTKDAFFVFERSQAKDLMIIFDRQYHR